MQSKKLNMMTASGGALTHSVFSAFTVFLRAKLSSSKGKLENDLAKIKQTHPLWTFTVFLRAIELLQCFLRAIELLQCFFGAPELLQFYSVFCEAWYPDVVPGCSRSKTLPKISKVPGYSKTKSDPDACGAPIIMMLMNVRTHFLQLFFHILLLVVQAVLFSIWKKTILLQEVVGILKTYSFRVVCA